MSEEKQQKKVAAVSLTEEQMLSDVLATKAWLDKEEKYRIRIRKDPDPKHPNYETVQINGYTYTIMKGVDVEVPKTVRDILIEASII